MIKVIILEDLKASSDGFTVVEYTEGEVATLPNSVAKSLVDSNFAEYESDEDGFDEDWKKAGEILTPEDKEEQIITPEDIGNLNDILTPEDKEEE